MPSVWSKIPSPSFPAIFTTCASSMHVLRMLRKHDLQQQQLNVVASTTTLASLLYASPAWWGYTSANDKARIDRLINILRRKGSLPIVHASFEELCKRKADQILFNAVSTNPNRVLESRPILTGNTNHWSHNLLPRVLSYVLYIKDVYRVF